MNSNILFLGGIMLWVRPLFYGQDLSAQASVAFGLTVIAASVSYQHWKLARRQKKFDRMLAKDADKISPAKP